MVAQECATITLKSGEELNSKVLAQAMIQALPAYAIPLFLRLKTDQKTTGTFKYRNIELKQEAFNPECVQDPLYVLLDKEQGYQLLTAKIYDQINSDALQL